MVSPLCHFKAQSPEPFTNPQFKRLLRATVTDPLGSAPRKFFSQRHRECHRQNGCSMLVQEDPADMSVCVEHSTWAHLDSDLASFVSPNA